MSKRLTDREKLLSKLDRLSDQEVNEILDYLQTLEKKRRERTQSESTDDELLMALSEALENCRARQVFEWESARRRAESRSSRYSYANPRMH